MANRKHYVGGNWKMNLHGQEVDALTSALISGMEGSDSVDVAICPAFPYLERVGRRLSQADCTTIKLGAQDCYWEANGAFTGEVSMSMRARLRGRCYRRD